MKGWRLENGEWRRSREVAPASHQSPTRPSVTGRILALIAVPCLLAPLAAFVWMFVQFLQLFALMADDETSRRASRAVFANVFQVTQIAFGTGLAGFLLAGIAVSVFSYRPAWLWRVLFTATVYWALIFPCVGVPFLIWLLRGRERFYSANPFATSAR